MFLLFQLSAQNCDVVLSKKLQKKYDKAWELQEKRQYHDARKEMIEVVKEEPNFAQAQMSVGLFYMDLPRPNFSMARTYFEKSIELCKDSALYAHFYLGKFYYSSQEYEKAIDCFEFFLEDVDRIKTDEDYFDIKNYLEYAKVIHQLKSNPVPFEPHKVEGISTQFDEYLPYISPDNSSALFIRRVQSFQQGTFQQSFSEREIFTYSVRDSEGNFSIGWEMEDPFNQMQNEGAATLTIDNTNLYYTVCIPTSHNYLNCDIYHSHFRKNKWSEIKSLGKSVNLENSWDSQPSVTSDGKTIYFASDRPGGYGGTDIYKVSQKKNGKWGEPENLGDKINTQGNEKSPFIHTDSQTLYFSSDGRIGMGGYDIFFTRQDENGAWQEPENIGYPINDYDDDLGFFASTDGQFGYYASNRFNDDDNWDLYSFRLYEEAQPQKVLFVKGTIDVENNHQPVRAKVELKNMKTKSIREIPVDSLTGKYVAAVLFKEDQVLTVKKEGYVYSSKYLSLEDTTLSQPKTVDLEIKEIKIDQEYEIEDIRFATNSYNLNTNAFRIIDEFYEFLEENPKIIVEIQGHTDDVGNDEANLTLSHKRAQSVYNYLIEKGIAEKRLSYQGFGESKPIASNETAFGRAKNRRTVFVIKNK